MFYRSSNDTVLLDQIVRLILDFDQNYGNFIPTLAVVVTWHGVPLNHDIDSMVRSLTPWLFIW